MATITKFCRSRVLIVAVAGMIFGSTALAASPGVPARDLVEAVVSDIFEELTARREALEDDPQAMRELVDRLVLPHFDFELMSRRVLGKRWKKATPEQQARFVSAFRNLLVRTYSILLNEYSGQTVTYLDPVPRKRDDEIIIPVRLELASNQEVRVAYVMRESATGWKVFDIAVDGVSLVTNYRSSFRSEIARHGVDGLIAHIEAKNSESAD